MKALLTRKAKLPVVWQLMIEISWLASGAYTCLYCARHQLDGLATLFWFITFLGSLALVFLMDYLGPKYKWRYETCENCGYAQATTSKPYWAHSCTIPSGKVELCDECTEHYDHTYDWSKARENKGRNK